MVQQDAASLFAAAKASATHKLALPDAIIWQTAQWHGAALYTQDSGLQNMQGVVLQVKKAARAV